MSESNLRPGNIRNFTIKGEDLSGNKTQHRNRAALVDLRYYENVLSNVITLSVGVQETDNLLNSLPISGGDEVKIKIEDVSGNVLSPTLYVNKITNVISDSLESDYFLELASKELFKNDETRVVQRYDGKISDNVKKYLFLGDCLNKPSIDLN